MQLGDASAGERTERSQLDEALNTLDSALNGLLDTIESGGLEQLSAAEKISFWQRFEAFRNRLPLVDHSLLADAKAHDLAGEYCFSSLSHVVDPDVVAFAERGGCPGASSRSRRSAHLN